MNLNKIFKKKKKPGLTLVVATTLIFAGPVAAHAATTGTDNAADNTGATSAPADGNNGIVGTEPGASTATGGIKIAKTTIGGRYEDKYSVNATLDIRVDYTGDKVEKGATFSVALGDGLQVPNGFNSVDLKATALDGSEKKIGKCTAENGAFNCVVTEDIAQTLGGNGSLKNGFVKLEATLNKSSIGKTTTNVVGDGTKYTVGLGKGVVGEPVTPDDNKFCWADGRTAEGLNKFGCWIQAQGQPGQTITITETRDDATFQGGIHVTPVDHGDWANLGVTKPKVTKSADGKSATFTLPSELSGDHMARIRVEVTTSEKTMTNTATVNGKEVTTTVTWRAKGSSGAETGEDEKPVTPTPAPTPDPEPKPDPKPSEPPVTPPVTPEDPKPAPTPEPSTPPVTPEPEKPAPTPDPTPDTPKPDPKPTPEQPTPNPDPKPTPEPNTPPVTPPAPTPTPEPSQPSTPEKPKPEPSKPSEPTDPAPTPDPKPSEPSVTPPATPEKPKPEKPAPAPEPKETPKETPSQPTKPSTPATPDKPGNSTPEHKGAVTGLAQTGASDTGLMIAGATALVTAGGIALLLRRRQNNN